MRLTMAIFAAVLSLVFSAQSNAAEVMTSVEGATTVNTEEVFTLMEEYEDLVIIDARKNPEYVKGHIEGAISLVNTDVTPETLAEHLETKETPVLFYCNGVKCPRSGDAAQQAVAEGYKNVYYYHEGLTAWKEEGLPLDSSN